MSDQRVTNVIDLFNTFQSDQEKEEFLKQQIGISISLMNNIKQLQEENAHLKQLLAGAVPLVGGEVTRIIVTPEEALLDGQIAILEERGRTHELTLEETKKLDLFIKNKRLIKEQSTTIQGETKPNKGKHSTAELIKIAQSKKDEENV